MKIFKYKNEGGIDHDESQFTRLGASVSNGEATIHRYIYFEAEAPNEDAADILGLDIFPQSNSAHPLHPSFKYYGNAQISPVTSSKKYWMADLEYSSRDPNAKDSDGNAVTKDTKPWKLKPTDISFTYPETTVAFTAAYNDKGEQYDKNGNVLIPVVNSAGDPFSAETSARDMQVSFTFATKNWSPEMAMEYANTINAKEIKVLGIPISAGKGLLMPPESNFVTVYDENSTRIKWQYWNVSVNILLNYSNTRLNRRFLNVGDRAKFHPVSLAGDALLRDANWPDTTLTASTVPSQICHFRLLEKVGESYIPSSEKLIFCSWDQYLEARKIYFEASKKLKDKGVSIYELQCEQDTQMPLDEDGYLLTGAIQGTEEYNTHKRQYITKTFLEFTPKDWKPLDLPKKGIDW